MQAQGADNTPTGIAACALGHTWSMDTKDLASQVLDDLKKQNIVATSVTADGTQTLTWALNGDVEIDSDYTVTITVNPAADQTTVATQTHKGKATGKAYINAEVAIPRDWDATGTKVSTKFVVNGTDLAAKDPAPFIVTQTDFDDEVGVELSCDGDTLTTHARGFPVTQTWKKSD